MNSSPPKDSTESKYYQKNVEKILNFRDLDYVPEPSSRHIKIFVCSQHDEFEYERMLLNSLVLPELQNFCLHYGYDIELIDFNYGTSIDPYYDSQLFEHSFTCLEECFTQSQGVFFIGFLGEKVGLIPLPANISASDMESITEYIRDDPKKMNLLSEWYSENNVSTPFYSLENIPKIFPFYYKRGNHDKSKLDYSKWVKIHRDLTNLLREGSHKAFQHQKIDIQMCHRSTLALQIQKALTLASTTNLNQCIFMTREQKFDCVEPDLKGQIMEYPHVFNIPKYNNRMSIVASQGKSNLENVLLQEVTPRIKALIQTSILASANKSVKIQNLLLKQVYKEVLIHLNHFTKIRSNIPNLITQPDIINCIKRAWGIGGGNPSKKTSPSSSPNKKSPETDQSLFDSQSAAKPTIILVGGEGSGKSTLVTQLLCLAHESFPRDKTKDTTIIIRYASLTPKTLNASQFLRNICLQLYFILKPYYPVKFSTSTTQGPPEKHTSSPPGGGGKGAAAAEKYDDEDKINITSPVFLDFLNSYNLARLVKEFSYLLRVFGDTEYLKRRKLFLFIEDIHHVFHPGTEGNIIGGGLINSQSPNNKRNSRESFSNQRTCNNNMFQKLFPEPMPANVYIVLTLNSNKYAIFPPTTSSSSVNGSIKNISPASTTSKEATPTMTNSPINSTAVAYNFLFEGLKNQFGPNCLIMCLDSNAPQPSLKVAAATKEKSNTEETGSGYATNNPLTIQEIFLSCYKRSKASQQPRWMHSVKEQHLITMTLPVYQKNPVNQSLLIGKSPLFAECLSIYIKDWHTKYKPPNTIPTNILLVIKAIFDQIDAYTDHFAFINVLKYLSSAHIGLTEVEMIDLLSSNKPLMELYYGTNLNIDVRFPYYMWILMKKQLSLLINEKTIDGKILMFWNHKIFSDIAKMYSIQKPIEKTQVHCDMANLFLETIYLSKETNLSNISATSTIPLNYRGITAQPLLFNDYQYNMRRIYELWFHLLYTGDIKLLKFHSLCNFDYLMAVIHGASLGYLFYMFDKTLNRFLDYELQTMCATLIKSVDILSKDHLQLACEIIGRLRNADDNVSPYLDNLVIEAMEWCDSCTLPLLVPLSSWLELSTPELYDAFMAHNTTSGLSILAPSSQHILLTTRSNQIHMYHLASHEFIRLFKGITGSVTALVIAYNSSFVACATTDLNISVWKIDKNEISGTLRPHDKEVTCMLLSLDDKLIFTGAKDGRVCWSSVFNFEIIKIINAHRLPVTSIVINSFNEVLASGSEDRTVKIWLIETGLPLNYVEDVSHPVRKMILSHDDIFLGVLCEEYHIQVRSLTTGSFLYRLDHKIPVTDFCFTIDSRFLILGCKDAKIYVYNVHLQTLNTIFTGHIAPIRNVLVTMNNDFLVSTCQDAVFIWNIKKHMKQENILSHKGVISCIKLSKDGTMAISGSEDGTVKLWNMEFSELQEKLPDHMKSVTCVNFSPHGNYMVSGSKDWTVNIKLLNETESFIRFTGHQSPITNAVFTQDEKSIVSSELNDIVKVWRVETGFTILNCSVFSRILMVSPNSLYAVSGNKTNSVKIWKVEDGMLINSITHTAEITCLSITPNSKICVTGSKDESLKVWEVTTGKLTQVLVGHEDAVTCVTTSQNNEKVISGSKDNSVIMWSVDTGSSLKTFADHTSDISSVAITQDNSIIISSSLDGTLRVWNSDKGTLITIFDCHMAILNFCMSSDANHIVVRLLNDPHLLLMCLHNSPAMEFKLHQLGSIEEDANSAFFLPIKMKPYRFSLFAGKNLIPKISTSTIPDQLIHPNPLSGISNPNSSVPTTNKLVGSGGAIGKGQPKLLRKQDSMSKIFFQTHHPFPCSPKMSDLIPNMNMEAKDKLIDSDLSNFKTPTEIANLRKNIFLGGNRSLVNNCYHGQAELFKAMTCNIQ